MEEPERKVVVSQKIVDDYYVNKYVWEVVDEEGVCYGKGEGKTMQECVEAGKKCFKKKRPYKESHSENDEGDESL